MYKTDYVKSSCSVGLRGYLNRLTIKQHSKINQDIFWHFKIKEKTISQVVFEIYMIYYFIKGYLLMNYSPFWFNDCTSINHHFKIFAILQNKACQWSRHVTLYNACRDWVLSQRVTAGSSYRQVSESRWYTKLLIFLFSLRASYHLGLYYTFLCAKVHWIPPCKIMKLHLHVIVGKLWKYGS